MKINKAHCFFEQSGTFKNEFIKLGIQAEDYDIQNSFQQPDHIIDLFGEINKAYFGKGRSVFDNITPDYARNFICDFIIGKSQVFTQTNLFD